MRTRAEKPEFKVVDRYFFVTLPNLNHEASSRLGGNDSGNMETWTCHRTTGGAGAPALGIGLLEEAIVQSSEKTPA